ncbi:MAG: hypothetical protein HRU32_12390 [Rhodobacteraceae bacterium]|nr:hypothetical protein [Paracoccaceae bacterium]
MTMTNFFSLFRSARRFEALFSMTDRELAARGYSREALARSYVSGLGAN